VLPLQSKNFSPFRVYVRQLDRIIRSPSPGRSPELAAALDGQPSAELRRAIALADLRSAGAFFTPAAMAQQAVAPLTSSINNTSVIADPACGAGDLLLALTGSFPIQPTLSATLADWGRRLVGRDLYRPFIASAVRRLALAAIGRGVEVDLEPNKIARLLPLIQRRSFLQDGTCLANATHIVLNPPFTRARATSDCGWSSGLVNTGAVFLERTMAWSKPGTLVSAILPEVLRSGSRYAKWRALISSRLKVSQLTPLGQFAPEVDVDVFLLIGEVRAVDHPAVAEPWTGSTSGDVRVEDLFEVRVGALVPHRHAATGVTRPVITARSLPAWGVVTHVEECRPFAGRAETPPFVAIRRTSRPGDKRRAVATIVATRMAVTAENHLLVLRPRDGLLSTCERLVRSLARPETTSWLDARIRCRHLTVGAIRELPLAP